MMFKAVRSLRRLFNPTRRLPKCASRIGISFDTLEERRLLDADGILTGDSAHLTLSFVPDGTDIGGHPSALVSTFNQVGSEPEWRQTILEAFQTWVSKTNGDIGVIKDGGQPMGTPGPRLHDERFGDIRIGAAPLSADVMAISVPGNSLVSGSWVGDVIFNSDAEFASIDELFSVALHEAGHVLGLEHSDSQDSVMHTHGPSPNIIPTQEDVLNLQDLYGERSADINEIEEPNDGFSEATELDDVTLPGQAEGSGPSIAFGDIANHDDRDFFELDPPSDYDGPISIRVRTNGLSLLTAKLSAYDEDGNLLGQSQSDGSSSDVSLRLEQPADDDAIFVVVEGLHEDKWSIGGYAVIATFDDVRAVSEQQIDSATDGRFRFVEPDDIRVFFQDGEDPLINDDGHTDDDFAFAVELGTSAGFLQSTRYEVTGSITNAADVDFYTFKTPAETSGPLLIALTSTDSGRLIPTAEVFDENLLPVKFDVLVNGDGQYTLQVSDYQANGNYVLKIGADAGGTHETGNYLASISVSQIKFELEPFVTGMVSPEAPESEFTFYVAEPQIFHFLLDAGNTGPSFNEAVSIKIMNETGTNELVLTALAGQTRSTSGVLLRPGTYTLNAQLDDLGGQGDNVGPISFEVSGATVSDPFGITPLDPIGEPEFRCDGVDDRFCFPDGATSNIGFFFNTTPKSPQNPVVGVKTQTQVISNWWGFLRPQNVDIQLPVANSDSFQTTTGQRLIVLAAQGVLRNDPNDDQSPREAVLVSPPQHGTLTFEADGGFSYVPDPDYAGVDSFQYRTRNVHGESAPTTVTITVEPRGVAGDANRDGIFNSTDLILVFRAGEYDDDRVGNSTWASGDWNGDGEFDSSDLILAFQQGAYVP